MTAIALRVNGEALEVPEGLTLAALLVHLGYEGPVAIERNREVVPRALHADTFVAPDDELEIVHFVGGG